jgi:hypothetical protein
LCVPPAASATDCWPEQLSRITVGSRCFRPSTRVERERAEIIAGGRVRPTASKGAAPTTVPFLGFFSPSRRSWQILFRASIVLCCAAVTGFFLFAAGASSAAASAAPVTSPLTSPLQRQAASAMRQYAVRFCLPKQKNRKKLPPSPLSVTVVSFFFGLLDLELLTSLTNPLPQGLFRNLRRPRSAFINIIVFV